MKNKKLYLSSKITGLSKANYLTNFNKLERKYKPNYIVINPTKLHSKKKSWIGYLITDILVLLSCGTIVMDTNWKDSRGCKIERFVAMLMFKKIIYEVGVTYNLYLIIYEAGKNEDGKLMIQRNSRLIKARNVPEAIDISKTIHTKKGVTPYILSLGKDSEGKHIMPEFQYVMGIKKV